MKKSINPFVIVKNIVTTYVKRLNDLAELATLEAKLAARSLAFIGLLVGVSLLLLLSTWACLLFIVYLLLTSHAVGALSATLIVTAINIAALIFSIWYMFRLKDNLFFKSTRRQISVAHLLGDDS